MKCKVFLFLSLMFFFSTLTAHARVVRLYQGKLNINTASAADLARLPGIGQVIGFRIVKDRERRGKFRQLAELKEVKGVSERTFEGLRRLVTTEGENDLKVHLDLNTVTHALLLGIPGMTEGEARSILNFRKAGEGFTKVEDLLRVPGIDRKRFTELSEWLAVAETGKRIRNTPQ